MIFDPAKPKICSCIVKLELDYRDENIRKLPQLLKKKYV